MEVYIYTQTSTVSRGTGIMLLLLLMIAAVVYTSNPFMNIRHKDGGSTHDYSHGGLGHNLSVF